MSLQFLKYIKLLRYEKPFFSVLFVVSHQVRREISSSCVGHFPTTPYIYQNSFHFCIFNLHQLLQFEEENKAERFW